MVENNDVLVSYLNHIENAIDHLYDGMQKLFLFAESNDKKLTFLINSFEDLLNSKVTQNVNK